jgi:hypothetical protein
MGMIMSHKGIEYHPSGILKGKGLFVTVAEIRPDFGE